MAAKNLAAILRHREKNFSLTELRRELIKLSKIENLILDARLDGISFCELNDTDLRIATDKIILNCSAIVGCEMPYTELFANVLSEQIITFLMDFGYSSYTLSEIMLSMRINCTQRFMISDVVDIEEIMFVGRCVNVNFISKVLKNYALLRNSLDRKLQNFIDGHI
jgi:hypothetical protein